MQTVNKLEESSVNVLTLRLSDEFGAYYFYRALSNWCKSVGYTKAAEYFAKESDDELTHAKKIESFLVDWNIIPQLPAITQPGLEFKSLFDGIEKAYAMEYALYESYENDGVKVFKTGDLCTFNLLSEYIQVQTKAVAEYSDMLNLLEGVNVDNKFEMLMLEEKLF